MTDKYCGALQSAMEDTYAVQILDSCVSGMLKTLYLFGGVEIGVFFKIHIHLSILLVMIECE